MSVRFLIEHEGRLARITLARPPLNILDVDHLGQLVGAIERARRCPIVLIDADPECRVFCAGNDIKDHVPGRAPDMLNVFHRAVRTLRTLDCVVVADVAGDALGAGCELVAACDLVYAREHARFGQPEIDVGCFPPVGAALLPTRIGWSRAAHLVLTGQPIDAATAADCGLITAVGEVPLDMLLAKSGAVLRFAKRALQSGRIDEAERIYLDELIAHPDCEEGVRAFLEKRDPDWA